MCVMGKTQSQLLEKLRMKMRRVNIATIDEEGANRGCMLRDEVRSKILTRD